MKNTNQIWQFFVSIKLTVGLLLSLAATSIIGTLIPQNASPEAYFHKYGALLYRMFDWLNLFDMYHSWWFQFLLILLTANIIACSIDRLSGTWKIIFPKESSFKWSRFKQMKNAESFSDMRTPDELEKEYPGVVSHFFGKYTLQKTDMGFRIFSEKWRWTRLGVYIVHASILFLIAGAMIGSLFGFEGYVNLPEGESIDRIRLKGTDQIQHLGFTIRCNDFDLSYYDNGMTKEYRSSLTIIENGQDVLKRDIIVNDPLRYEGINIFLSGFGELPPERAETHAFSEEDIFLDFFVKASGMTYKKKAEIGKPMDIPEGMGKLVIMAFRESATFMGQPIGEALIGILTPPGGEPVQVTLPIHFPNFDKMRRGDVVISVANQEAKIFAMGNPGNKRYYTGLQVTKDPGVWVVYTGFVIMIIGIVITFFMSHQRVCIDVSREGEKSRITVMGKADKNKLGMQEKIKSIAKLLTE